MRLRQNISCSLQCPFIDVMDSEDRAKENTNAAVQRSSPDSSLFKHVMVEDALRALIESIRHRSGLLNIYNKSAPSNPGEPDIRYVICLFPYVKKLNIVEHMCSKVNYDINVLCLLCN